MDQIGDPLQHLLRNSADHGLEDTELRIQRGKPEVGNIFLNAYQEGNNVIIQVGDDGNGIDTEAVKAKAIERNIITPEQAEVMTQKEIINLLFMPSFSMAKKITDISGRGVGLDVVKSNIEQLGGDVEVKTKLGEGTTFTVRLPLTLAIIQALMVEVRDEKYAIALGSIANIESVPVSSIKYVEAKEVIHLRGSVIPLVRLDKLLDIEPREEEPESLTVVIVKKGDSQVGLVVDDLMGQQEIVIKSLGKYREDHRQRAKHDREPVDDLRHGDKADILAEGRDGRAAEHAAGHGGDKAVAGKRAGDLFFRDVTAETAGAARGRYLHGRRGDEGHECHGI